MREEARIADVLEALTLEEKALLLSGGGAWETAAVERLEIRPAVLTDGPHGVRRQADAGHFSLDASLPATCFPTAAALGSSWDAGLLTEVGEALGAETRAAGVAVLLGPGINIKRTPLCGRDFEYLSEDPVVSGQLGAALVRGIQSQGVGCRGDGHGRGQGRGRHRPDRGHRPRRAGDARAAACEPRRGRRPWASARRGSRGAVGHAAARRASRDLVRAVVWLIVPAWLPPG